MNKVWKCKIGVSNDVPLPPGADGPMRDAVQKAFKEVTGLDAHFTFSGWGGALDENEQRVVDHKD